MAFWSNWFKVNCLECGAKYDKQELTTFEERLICSDCHDGILEDRRLKEIERQERIAREEEARKALLDRNYR